MNGRARRLQSIAMATALMATEVAAVVAFVRLGRTPGFAVPLHHLGAWARHASTEDLVAAIGRVGGLVVAGWLPATTLLSLAHRVVPAARSWQSLDRATPPTVRRLLDRLVVVGLGTSMAVAAIRPAGAATGSAHPVVRAPAIVATVDEPVPRVPPAVAPSTPAPTPKPRAPATTPNRTVVRPGDNLWLIAARAIGSNRAATVAPYWRALIAANASTLRSHDPNLIFPGEWVVLPPQP